MPFWSSILDFICPPTCAGCNRLGEPVFCSVCLTTAPRHSTLYCAVCLARLPTPHKICHPQAEYLLGAATEYSCEPIHNAIHALKFQGVRSVAEPLGELLADYARKLPIALADYYLLPIPLSPERERERGYNQAELIAKVVAERTGCSLVKDWLVRIRHRSAQSLAKSRAERAENIAGCFAVPDPAVVQNKKIILIDDVATSGATLAEAARVLRQAGAKQIIALVVARA